MIVRCGPTERGFTVKKILVVLATTAALTFAAAPAQAKHNPQGVCTKDKGVTTCTETRTETLPRTHESYVDTGEGCFFSNGMTPGAVYDVYDVRKESTTTTKYKGHRQIGEPTTTSRTFTEFAYTTCGFLPEGEGPRPT